MSGTDWNFIVFMVCLFGLTAWAMYLKMKE